MRKSEIYKCLTTYAKKRPVRFHMPGHKGKSSVIKGVFVAEDITELSFSDALINPDGVIKKAQDTVSEILRVKKCFFTTDGSTSAVLSMLYAVSKLGKKIIINRGAHASVYNGLALMNIEPIIVGGFIDGEPTLPTATDIESAILENPDTVGVFLTSPDYFGNAIDLAGIKEVTKAHGKLFFIDGAHGSHLRFTTGGLYAGDYADAHVDGVHKTLPCLTQTAVLCVNEQSLIDLIEEGLRIFRTSSPNYLLLASIEQGVYFMQEKGRVLIDGLKKAIAKLIEKTKSAGVTLAVNDDPLKLTLYLDSMSLTATQAEELFESNAIYLEMIAGGKALIYLSPLTSVRELKKLERVLLKAKRKTIKMVEQEKTTLNKPVKKLEYLTAVASQTESVPLNDAVGRVSGASVGLFPPCYPLVTAGEVFDEETVNLLKNSYNTFGVTDGKVKVIK